MRFCLFQVAGERKYNLSFSLSSAQLESLLVLNLRKWILISVLQLSRRIFFPSSAGKLLVEARARARTHKTIKAQSPCCPNSNFHHFAPHCTINNIRPYLSVNLSDYCLTSDSRLFKMPLAHTCRKKITTQTCNFLFLSNPSHESLHALVWKVAPGCYQS